MWPLQEGCQASPTCLQTSFNSKSRISSHYVKPDRKVASQLPSARTASTCSAFRYHVCLPCTFKSRATPYHPMLLQTSVSCCESCKPRQRHGAVQGPRVLRRAPHHGNTKHNAVAELQHLGACFVRFRRGNISLHRFGDNQLS